MKGRLIVAFLFALFIYLGTQQLSEAQPPAIPPQLAVIQDEHDCTLPSRLPTAPKTVLQTARLMPVFCAQRASVPVCSSNGTPLLSQSYYRSAYQAFHFSDSAG